MNNIIVKEGEELVVPVLWTGEETDLAYTILLSGMGASVKFVGLLLGHETRQLKFHVTVIHQARETKSEVIIKSALRDASQVHFDGLIKIEPGAKGTNAWLAAHLLLLSARARGSAVPNLEILENDVKAGHATTVGRINEMELFYLMSRGISEEKAKELIVQGFLEDMIALFPKGKRLRVNGFSRST